MTSSERRSSTRSSALAMRGHSGRTMSRSISTRLPEWYKDAKFGIFIHWGVYSVPAYGSEWYPREMYIQGSDVFKHHVATYGPQNKFGYKDFIPMFKAEKFDPQAWAHLFKESGAKYVVPVFEHHDGFAMYDSGLSDWTVAKMGPHRDTERRTGQGGARRGPASWRVLSPRGAQLLSGRRADVRFGRQ